MSVLQAIDLKKYYGTEPNLSLIHIQMCIRDSSYIYQCYGQLRTGTPAGRLKKGLDIEGICDNSSFMAVSYTHLVQKVLGEQFVIPEKKAMSASTNTKKEHNFG